MDHNRILLLAEFGTASKSPGGVLGSSEFSSQLNIINKKKKTRNKTTLQNEFKNVIKQRLQNGFEINDKAYNKSAIIFVRKHNLSVGA